MTDDALTPLGDDLPFFGGGKAAGECSLERETPGPGDVRTSDPRTAIASVASTPARAAGAAGDRLGLTISCEAWPRVVEDRSDAR